MNKKIKKITEIAAAVLLTVLLPAGVSEAARQEKGFELIEVSPRIFTPGDEMDRVKFDFVNPNFSEVSIKIYDVAGRLVRSSISELSEEKMYWNGKDENGEEVPVGVYLYSLEADGENITGLVVVAK